MMSSEVALSGKVFLSIHLGEVVYCYEVCRCFMLLIESGRLKKTFKITETVSS